MSRLAHVELGGRVSMQRGDISIILRRTIVSRFADIILTECTYTTWTSEVFAPGC